MTDEPIEKLDPTRSRGQLLIDAYRAERTQRRGTRQTKVEQLRATLRAGRPQSAGPATVPVPPALRDMPEQTASPPSMPDVAVAAARKSVFAHLLDTAAPVRDEAPPEVIAAETLPLEAAALPEQDCPPVAASDAPEPVAASDAPAPVAASDAPEPVETEAVAEEPEPASVTPSPGDMPLEIEAVAEVSEPPEPMATQATMPESVPVATPPSPDELPPEIAVVAEPEAESAVAELSHASEPPAIEATAPVPDPAPPPPDEAPPQAEAPATPAETPALVGLAGFGLGMTLRLSQLGYHTAADLADADPAQLRQALGTISSLLDVDAWIENARRHRGPA